MSDIIDVSQACGKQARALADAGVQTIIRYYSRDTGIPEKRLSALEARAFAAEGLRIAVVHEARRGDTIGAFSAEKGALDAAYCIDYARNIIGQPSGSAIYFAVDFDASALELKMQIIPYFQSVKTALTAPGVGGYKIGVYGSGRTCQTIAHAGLANHTWLAQSTGWADHATYLKSNAWALRQLAATKLGEVRCDPDIANGPFGDFVLAVQPHAESAERIVIAREGLRMRAGPGVEHGVVRVLPLDARVHELKLVGDWAMIDINGDGAADGFVSRHYLR
ncbi:MAG: DUF1906 domain-containing protein [Phycisphaerales bacterium]|nr:DUF1906 domain-containing protein [Hyphomonadaceae bacterium]